MGVEDSEQQFSKEMEILGGFDTENEEGSQTRPLHSPSLKLEMSSNDGDASPQFENSEKGIILDHVQLRNSFPLERICEESSVADKKQVFANDFIPALRSGEWSDIGCRSYMEDTHICIENLAKYFQCEKIGEEAISLYGVFDGHDGEGAAQFVRDQLPRVIVEDVDFPLELEKVVKRSFMKTDAAFANSCSLESALSSGTTALIAMIFGRSLLVANAGDCRAVLSRGGVAIEMSKIHRPCSMNERMRIESLGGYIVGELLNGCLGVTRALGDWHIEGLKKGEKGGPLSAEPELKLWTLTKEDEFLIIGSDGIWDVFINQNAVDFTRRKLQEHNNVKRCCREIVDEAKKREANDNLTVIIVCFHLELPPSRTVQRTRVGRIFPDWGPLRGYFPQSDDRDSM